MGDNLTKFLTRIPKEDHGESGQKKRPTSYHVLDQ